MVIAFTTAWTIPLIESIGVLWTDILFAVLAWFGFAYVPFDLIASCEAEPLTSSIVWSC